jgi:peptidoglycan-associated lipoprotein
MENKMNTTLKLGLVLSSFLFLAACETPGEDGSASGSGANGEYGSGSDSLQQLAPGVSDRVFFALDSSVLDGQAQATLEKQAGWLKSNGGVNVVVEGHCDERGTREYNLALGERRANAAKDYLVSLGVSPARVTTISYGKERAAVTGSNEAAWSQNRRAVTVLAR